MFSELTAGPSNRFPASFPNGTLKISVSQLFRNIKTSNIEMGRFNKHFAFKSSLEAFRNSLNLVFI